MKLYSILLAATLAFAINASADWNADCIQAKELFKAGSNTEALVLMEAVMTPTNLTEFSCAGIEPHSSIAYIYARALKKAGRKAEAQLALNTILSSTNSSSHYKTKVASQLGQSYMKNKQPAAAITVIEPLVVGTTNSVTGTNAASSHLMSKLARAYKRAGRTKNISPYMSSTNNVVGLGWKISQEANVLVFNTNAVGAATLLVSNITEVTDIRVMRQLRTKLNDVAMIINRDQQAAKTNSLKNLNNVSDLLAAERTGVELRKALRGLDIPTVNSNNFAAIINTVSSNYDAVIAGTLPLTGNLLCRFEWYLGSEATVSNAVLLSRCSTQMQRQLPKVRTPDFDEVLLFYPNGTLYSRKGKGGSEMQELLRDTYSNYRKTRNFDRYCNKYDDCVVLWTQCMDRMKALESYQP